jgi:hypothetical protein
MRKLRAFTRPSALAAFIVLGAGAVTLAPHPTVSLRSAYGDVALDIPTRLSDSAFWQMMSDFSEPGGYFRSDNLVSNELTFQHVIPALVQQHGTGGIYLGVGPDQNFTYLVALKPRISFIVDIRRGNLQQHLLYKALIELSPTRADFLSLLFSRPRPATALPATRVDSLFTMYDSVAADSVMYKRTFAAVRRTLMQGHHFPLTQPDIDGIEYVFRAFFESGPQLTYSFGTGTRGYYGAWRGMPTYAELMVQTDADSVTRGYLASEANFQILRELEGNNLIVPIVGDFAGDKALRAVGAYLKTHGAVVSAVYTSNVEQYLFQAEDAWRRYYANVATLPLDTKSTFVRAVFNYGGWRDPGAARGPRSVTMLSPVSELVTAVQDGRVQSYWDVIQFSHSPVEVR